MKLFAGKVIEGKVVVNDCSLEEGTTVTVLVGDESEAFAFAGGEEAEMVEALAEAERGDFVDGDEFLRTLNAPQ